MRRRRVCALLPLPLPANRASERRPSATHSKTCAEFSCLCRWLNYRPGVELNLRLFSERTNAEAERTTGRGQVLTRSKNMTDRMSDSIRERQYSQYCHNSSQLSQKFLIDDNYHKVSQLLIIVTIGHNCHNFSQLSKLSDLSQLPCQNCHLSNWSVSKIGQNSYYWSQLLQLFAIVYNSTVTIIVCHYW